MEQLREQERRQQLHDRVAMPTAETQTRERHLECVQRQLSQYCIELTEIGTDMSAHLELLLGPHPPVPVQDLEVRKEAAGPDEASVFGEIARTLDQLRRIVTEQRAVLDRLREI